MKTRTTPTFNQSFALAGNRSGQTFMLFVVMILVIFLFVGLALDVGFAYITHAQLSKAVDSAALAAVRNLFQGKSAAGDLAKATFFTNYGTSGRDKFAPTISVRWQDSTSNIVVNVGATSVINTFFLRALPQWKTLTVSASAQAIRTKVKLMLVLDRSGSMRPSGITGFYYSNGCAALPSAVSAFLKYTVESLDEVGMTSFGTLASLDVPMRRTSFKNDIVNAANRMCDIRKDKPEVCQWTYADGGLQYAYSQMASNAPIPSEGSVQTFVVFFTDGYANTSLLTPSDSPPRLVSQSDSWSGNRSLCWEIDYTEPNGDPTSCGNQEIRCNKDNCYCCRGTFVSIDGTTKSICSSNQNVWLEGQLQALNTARLLRGAQGGVSNTIYTIGLGQELNKEFLLEIANDKSAKNYDASQPTGEAVFAPTTADMQAVFEQIAKKINMRLSQ
jgi:Flp pilus assembly protein TadG